MNGSLELTPHFQQGSMHGYGGVSFQGYLESTKYTSLCQSYQLRILLAESSWTPWGGRLAIFTLVFRLIRSQQAIMELLHWNRLMFLFCQYNSQNQLWLIDHNISKLLCIFNYAVPLLERLINPVSTLVQMLTYNPFWEREEWGAANFIEKLLLICLCGLFPLILLFWNSKQK